MCSTVEDEFWQSEITRYYATFLKTRMQPISLFGVTSRMINRWQGIAAAEETHPDTQLNAAASSYLAHYAGGWERLLEGAQVMDLVPPEAKPW